jgi:DNA (cytosine-5)-methyltransferase 1
MICRRFSGVLVSGMSARICAVEAGDLTRRPTAVDLFSGAGGLSLGFEQAGFDVLTSVEYDPVHAAVHEFNFPLTQVLCADVAQLRAEDLEEAIAQGAERHGRSWDEDDDQIDVVFGGPPCQGFSSIGKRLIDDERNQLVFHFFRIVSELRPRYFAMENVPGMTRGGHAGILEQLIEEFEGIGYRTIKPYRVLNAADYGVPQERKRLFLIGAREDQPLPSYPAASVRAVPKRAGQARGKADSSLPDGPSVWDAIGDLPDLNDIDELAHGDAVELEPEILSKMESDASEYAKRLRGLAADADDRSHPREWDRGLLTSSAQTAHTQTSIDRFVATLVGETEPVSRFYRLDPEGLCNTLRAGSGSERGAFTSPRPLHPTSPRVLSVREAARLHSFPDWFRLHETKWHGFRQIGNAVAPLVGRAVAAQLVEAMELDPATPATTLDLGDPALLRMTMQQATAHFGVDKSAVPRPRVRTVSRRSGTSEKIAA